MTDDDIIIRGASENNLKNISLRIPKKQITVVTGVSGSGKSSLVLDTIAAKSRRELNDTFPSFVQQYLPKYGRPHVEEIENLPIAIVIEQRKPASNSRSTVGTYTDIYSLLRLMFSRIGQPFIGYSDIFSFNHPMGSCPRCAGLGEIRELDIHKLVDFNKSLNDDDTIHYIAFGKGGWRWIRYAYSGLFDLDKRIKDYTPDELELFLNSPQIKLKDPPKNWPKSAKYEGLIPRMYRSIINSEEGLLHASVLNPMLTMGTCPDCKGTRLNEKILSCKIKGLNIAEVTAMSIADCRRWMEDIDDAMASDIRHATLERLSALEEIGLGYLTLDRAIGTLSGGEAQRCKIAKYINSPLSDVLYILDEPSVGLHNHDILLMQDSVKKLKRHGNTVILVEHHKDMIKIADHIIDMGPGSGADGGKILFEGSYPELLASHTLTGELLSAQNHLKSDLRKATGFFHLKNATLHNLNNLSVDLPLGVMCGIVGVAGSGKSSLMECFQRAYPHPEEIVYISQKNIGISLRSTPATYLDVSDDIRKLFAKHNKVKMDLFSFNGKGGCPVCQGKGVIVSDMAFMDSIETICEACGGLRYSNEVLRYQLIGMNIAEVMDLTAEKACELFAESVIAQKLKPLLEVGLGYLHLNQSLSTLSGGELQRIKLASYLRNEGKIFILDEPSDGLHLNDINRILKLFNDMVAAGNTIFLIEHNLEMLKACDYAIELGPGGGNMGGHIIFQGTPNDMTSCVESVTGPYLTNEKSISHELQTYVEQEILPCYDHFDAAHQRDHANDVIRRSLALAKHYDVNINMVYAIAAYHDTGLIEGRDTHHLVSGRIIRDDTMLRQWFNEMQIESMAQAAEDHRASAGHEPRSIYGKIVAEADRLIIPDKVAKRTMQYTVDHYPELNKEQQYERFREHMMEKYADGGYLKLWLPESENASQLEILRQTIRNEERLRETFERIFATMQPRGNT